jgi:hypothetical protein
MSVTTIEAKGKSEMSLRSIHFAPESIISRIPPSIRFQTGIPEQGRITITHGITMFVPENFFVGSSVRDREIPFNVFKKILNATHRIVISSDIEIYICPDDGDVHVEDHAIRMMLTELYEMNKGNIAISPDPTYSSVYIEGRTVREPYDLPREGVIFN